MNLNEKKKMTITGIGGGVVVITTIILNLVGILDWFGISPKNSRENKNNEISQDSILIENNTEEPVVSSVETEPTITEAPTEPETEPPTEPPTDPPTDLPTEPPTEEVPWEVMCRGIFQTSEPQGWKGCYYDFNNDGVKELLATNIINHKSFLYFDVSPIHTDFGGYECPEFDSVYDVTCVENIHYIYYREDYQDYTVEGYFDPITKNKIDVVAYFKPSIIYGYLIDWHIYYNDVEIYNNSGSLEYNKTEYILPESCENSLMVALSTNGFAVTESSTYSYVPLLSYDDLMMQLTQEIQEKGLETDAPEEIS